MLLDVSGCCTSTMGRPFLCCECVCELWGAFIKTLRTVLIGYYAALDLNLELLSSS